MNKSITISGKRRLVDVIVVATLLLVAAVAGAGQDDCRAAGSAAGSTPDARNRVD